MENLKQNINAIAYYEDEDEEDYEEYEDDEGEEGELVVEEGEIYNKEDKEESLADKIRTFF